MDTRRAHPEGGRVNKFEFIDDHAAQLDRCEKERQRQEDTGRGVVIGFGLSLLIWVAAAFIVWMVRR